MDYENIAKQFDNLTDEEKMALLVYKSKLGLLINDLDNNPNYQEYYDYALKIKSNLMNMFVLNTYFKILDLSTLESFIDSIKNVKYILDKTLGKIKLSEDTEVYRAVSTNDDINDISKSNIISTSLSFGQTLLFAQSGNNINIYKIKLHKDNPILCIPYSILYDEKRNYLTITSIQTQDEIILNKDDYIFEKSTSIDINPNTKLIELEAIKKDIRTL